MATLSPALLAPWRKTLRGLRVYPAAATNDSPSSRLSASHTAVWIQWTLPSDSSRAKTTRCLEAIELLVLLAWADFDSWMEVAKALRDEHHYSLARSWTTLVVEAQRPVRVFGHDVTRIDTRDAQVFCEYLGSLETEEDGVSSEYKAARAKLEAAIDRGVQHIPFRMRVMARRPWLAVTVGALPSVAVFAKTQSRLPSSNEEASRAVSRIATLRSRTKAVFNDMRAHARVTEQVLKVMHKIWKRGIAVIDFPEIERTLEPSDSEFYVRVLRSLFGVQCHGCVRRVSLGHPIESALTPTLPSALAFSSSVRKVAYEFQHIYDDSAQAARRAVQWMAYALFSCHAANGITSLSLHCVELLAAHVDAIRELFDAEDPLYVLYPEHAAGIQEYRWLRLAASSAMLRQSALAEDDSPTQLDRDLTDLRVLDRSGGWWCVLFPGWGEAWIREESAVVTHVATSAPTSSVRSIAQIKLYGCTAVNEPAIRNLLRLIGGGVSKLCVKTPTQAIDDLCDQVFASCPRLEELVLHAARYDRLASIPDFFAAGRCRHLRKMELNFDDLTHSALDELGSIFDILADREHPMAQQLEVLEVDTFSMVDGVDCLDLTVLHRGLRMLQANSSLEQLRLHLPLKSRDVDAVVHLKQGFDDQHGVLLPVRLAPLGLRAKTAFLSVVWGSDFDTESAIHRFDRHVVALVFAFSPERRKRQLDVAMPR